MTNEADRRRGVRTSPRGYGEAGTIEIVGKSIPVLVVDRAVRGIGLVAANLPKFSVDAHVTFRTPSAEREGRIVSADSVTLAETEIWRLGIEWLD